MRILKTTGNISCLTIMVMLMTLLAAGCGGEGAGDESEAPGKPIKDDLPAIVLIAPDTAGAGEVPGFEWEAVNGAASYRLVVLDGRGALLWAWNGSQTKVNLGGLPGERPEGVSGPVIDEESSWSVIAFDANGNAAATSEIRSVSP